MWLIMQKLYLNSLVIVLRWEKYAFSLRFTFKWCDQNLPSTDGKFHQYYHVYRRISTHFNLYTYFIPVFFLFFCLSIKSRRHRCGHQLMNRGIFVNKHMVKISWHQQWTSRAYQVTCADTIYWKRTPKSFTCIEINSNRLKMVCIHFSHIQRISKIKRTQTTVEQCREKRSMLTMC